MAGVMPRNPLQLMRGMRPQLERMGVLSKVSYALNDLDQKLLAFISHRNGVFIEAGANDGNDQSNTKYLELYLGWRGLLVEPIPELAQKCRKNRPNSIVEECALVSRYDRRDAVDMTYCNLMSLVDGARGSVEADSAHIQKGRQFLRKNESVRRVTVRTDTLNALILRHGLDHIDLLSLDVEGFEAEALAGLDFDNVAPKWILVEANDEGAVEQTLGDRYELAAQLSHHDKLYKLL
ncbi:MAG: FkbM family methyltransferase [Hyphomicrobiaceae bacterium]